jgi:D-alanyl-D-alanine carboxypeptidase
MNRPFRRAVTAAVMSLAAAGGLAAQQQTESASVESTTSETRRLTAAVDSAVQEVLATGWVPGVSVAVASGPGAPLLRSYGFADLEQRVRMTPETVMPFGSILKQFTAAAVLRLAEEGALRLDEPVTDFFPAFPSAWRAVTVHHLLNHTSGVPRALAPGWGERARNTRGEILQEIADRGALEFSPGERWVYNNAAYVILALIVEERSGEPFDHHLRRTLLEPLGMRSTGNTDSIAPGLPRAMGYDTVQGRLVERPISGNAVAMGAGFYHSTAEDLFRWQEALRSGAVLRPESFGRMTTPTVLRSGESWPYGYGVWLRELDGRQRVGHGGIQAGFRPFAGFLPEEDLSVVVLINSGAVDPWAVGESVLRAVLLARAAKLETP